jgi:hypothetical protein
MKSNGKHKVNAQIAGPGLVLAALLVLVLSSAGIGRAQAGTASSAVPAATPAKAAPVAQAVHPVTPAKRQPGGTHEGITVHGHWVIEVRDPDGRLVQHREFENLLTSVGAQNLPLFLSGFEAPGGWYIELIDPNNTATGSPCAGSPTPGAPAGACYLTQSTSTYDVFGGNPLCTTSGPCSANLTPSVGNPITGLVLTGSITATQIGNVGAVGTFLATCYPSTSPGNNLPFYTFSPAQCATGKSGVSNGNIQSVSFTAAQLPQAGSGQCGGANQPSCAIENVQPKQVISVSVTISFQ